MDGILMTLGFVGGFIAYLLLPAFILIRQNALNKKNSK